MLENIFKQQLQRMGITAYCECGLKLWMFLEMSLRSESSLRIIGYKGVDLMKVAIECLHDFLIHNSCSLFRRMAHGARIQIPPVYGRHTLRDEGDIELPPQGVIIRAVKYDVNSMRRPKKPVLDLFSNGGIGLWQECFGKAIGGGRGPRWIQLGEEGANERVTRVTRLPFLFGKPYDHVGQILKDVYFFFFCCFRGGN